MKRLAFIAIILFFALAGCAPAASNQSVSESPPGAPSQGIDSYESGAEEMPAAEPVSDFDQSNMGQSNGDRLVIRNANMTIVVEDPAQSMSTIGQMAETMGGFIVSSNLYKTYKGENQEIPEANITIRVPAEQLNDALDQIKALVNDPSTDIRAETVSGQDVTREYTDLNSRLKNLEITEAQLQEILGSARTTDDVLAVHQQLSQVRSEIEVLKGQIQYYEEAAALSSIAVVLQSLEGVQPIEIGGWRPVGVARSAVQTMIDTMQFIGSIVIWLVLYVLPVALVIFIPIRLLWMVFSRSRKNRPENTPATPPPAAPPV